MKGDLCYPCASGRLCWLKGRPKYQKARIQAYKVYIYRIVLTW